MKKLVLTILVLFKGFSAGAGVFTSGGGYAVVCQGQQGQVASVELLDLFEARRLYKLTLVKSTGQVESDLSLGTKNTYWLQREMVVNDPTSIELLKLNTQRWLSSRVWINSPAQLAKVNDLGDIRKIREALGPKCRLEQVALMDDKTRKVFILKPLWDRMDSLSQAALMKHEMFYWLSRKFVVLPEETSERIRRSVGLIYSATKIPTAIAGIPSGLQSKTILHDLNANTTGRWDSTTYYVFPAKKGGHTRIQFLDVGGRVILSPTYVDVPSNPILGDRFPINSFQLSGWYLQATQDMTNSTKLVLRIFSEKNMAVVDLR